MSFPLNNAWLLVIALYTKKILNVHVYDAHPHFPPKIIKENKKKSQFKC